MTLFKSLMQLSRRKSPWIFFFNSGSCNGCDIELAPCLSPRYDIEQLGMLHTGSPKHTDILVVTGPVCLPHREALRDVYDQIPHPKVVVAVGSCPASGDVFAGSPSVAAPLERFIPVDVYVPGCPPRPQTIIAGLRRGAEILSGERGREEVR
jgi:Ni,Fe-hydrogenase III small subunit